MAPGDGTRLAQQLASNALVFIVEGGKPQWYSHLLKPFIHYIPIAVNDMHSNLAEMLAWAVDMSMLQALSPNKPAALQTRFLVQRQENVMLFTCCSD